MGENLPWLRGGGSYGGAPNVAWQRETFGAPLENMTGLAPRFHVG
jgi:hypothetical protein